MTPHEIFFVIVCIFLMVGVVSAQEQDAAAAPAPAADGAARAQSQAKANQQVERQRKDAQQQAQNSIDPDAAAAIQETAGALKALDSGSPDEARAAIERAAGKITILTARKPETALIPAAVDVQVIDTAPVDVNMIRQIAEAAEEAVDDRDYPAARVLLAGLVSEMRIRVYNIPLATYPAAMRNAARLLDQQKTGEAKAVIQLALNTLVIVDRVEPLPIVTAQAAIEEAQTQRDQDKDTAKKQLAVAKQELDRAKALGYAGNDPEYAALASAISDIEKQLNGGEDSTSAFTRLRDRVASFFKRVTASEKWSEVASR
jgi:hypothetical protein